MGFFAKNAILESLGFCLFLDTVLPDPSLKPTVWFWCMCSVSGVGGWSELHEDA